MVLNDAGEKFADSLMIGATPDTDLMGAKNVSIKTAFLFGPDLLQGVQQPNM